jgi:hypothetical protein
VQDGATCAVESAGETSNGTIMTATCTLAVHDRSEASVVGVWLQQQVLKNTYCGHITGVCSLKPLPPIFWLIWSALLCTCWPMLWCH